MKIVHVITSLDVGGAERMLARLVAAQPRSIECHVICLGGEGPVAADLRDAGATVHALGMGARKLRDAFSLARIAFLVRKLHPDVVQTWLYHADLVGAIAARLAGVDTILWNIRSVEVPETSRALTHRVIRACALASSWLPTRIVCCSETAQRVHEQRGYDGRRFVIIPNGFDVHRFAPNREARSAIRRECRIPEDAPLIGLVARLDPLKNHALFFAAAKKLHVTNPEAHFLLAGKDINDSKPVVEQWVREAGVREVTRLLGQRRDVDHVMASLDVATCCSTSEAFPNTLAEAMSCAVPCVTTAVGDAPSIVGDTGYVVAGDADALATAWRRLLSLPIHERLRLGELARERVRSNFEIHAVTGRYLRLYESLIPRSMHG